MTKLQITVVLCAICLPLVASGEVMGANVLPADVAAFVERRDGCDHFRGEVDYDEARAAEINAELERLCKGTDRDLVRLKKHYSKDPAVRKALAGYEENIE